MAVESVEMTNSGVAFEGRCLFHGFHVGGTDYANDVIITIYDNDSLATGTKLVATHKIDADVLGLNGAYWMVGKVVRLGIYVEITTAGTASVICDIGQP